MSPSPLQKPISVLPTGNGEVQISATRGKTDKPRIPISVIEPRTGTHRPPNSNVPDILVKFSRKILSIFDKNSKGLSKEI